MQFVRTLSSKIRESISSCLVGVSRLVAPTQTFLLMGLRQEGGALNCNPIGQGPSSTKNTYIPPSAFKHPIAERGLPNVLFIERLDRRESSGSMERSGTSVWRPQSRYTVSRIECRSKFPQNQRCRAKIALHPPQIKVLRLSPDLPVALSIRSRQGAKGGVLRRAGGGYHGSLGFRKRIALQGGVAATVTPVALLCATTVLWNGWEYEIAPFRALTFKFRSLTIGRVPLSFSL